MRSTDLIDQLNESLVGRYRVEREIGVGGMATVYLARDLRHDRRVAVKVLDAELGAVLGSERFLSEIRVTANLHHPNLLPLFDSGEAKGLLFYVMPFVEGESLRARLDREKELPVDDAVRIAVAVAGALESAHRQGVIHRDLKPGNVLMHEGQPLVADFGIALAVSKAGGERVTQTGMSLGTPHYMSPEQATGDHAIDRRCDIYSLGAMTYEMLTGEPPHTGKSAQAIIARVLTEVPRSIRASRPAVPEHVEDAVMRALEKLPADRWPSAEAFAEALRGGERTTFSGRATSARYPARGPSWRTRLRDPLVMGLLVVAALASVVAAATARLAWKQRVASAVPQPVIRFPLTISRSPAMWNIHRGTLALAPDGTVTAFVGAGALGSPVLFVRALNELHPRALEGTEGAEQPFFSPDGRWIGFWSDGRLQKVSVEGGAAITIAPVAPISGATWSPSGVIVLTQGRGLATVPQNGGPVTPLTSPDSAHGEYSQFFPVVLSDGETVLYASQREANWRSSRIGVASISTRKAKILELEGISPLGVVGGRLIYASAGKALLAVPFDVREMRVTGSPTQALANVSIASAGIANAALSAEGSVLFQSESRESRLVSVDMLGNEKPLSDDSRMYGYPRLSPDGTRTAVVIGSGSRSDVWIIDNASRVPTRVTTQGTDNDRPEWTPDGRQILFRSDRGGTSALWLQAAEFGGAATPLLAGNEDYYEGVISPDGRTVAYQVDVVTADLMYRAIAGDTTPRAIAATASGETMPRFSPDGRWIAYVTRSGGTTQVVAQPFPGPGPVVQISDGLGSEPVWSRDGRHLYYRDGTHLVDAVVATRPRLAVQARHRLFADPFAPAAFPHANYDVGLDGSSFIFLRAAQDPQVVVVRNWAAELAAQLAVRR